MAAEQVLVTRQGAIATLTLNRPAQRNALSVHLMEDLTRQLRELGHSRRIRAIILAGAGSAFSAGHDLREMRHRSLADYRAIFSACTELMSTVQQVAPPVIARVHGMATAAGCQLVASCDLAVASEEARFATPGVRIGLFCTTPMVALTRAIGRKRALEMLLTGMPIDAATAAAWGLINRVVPARNLEAETLALAQAITRFSPLAVALGKRAFYAQIDLGQAQAYAYGQEIMSMNALAADAQEGMSAFLDKRRPRWRGK